MPLHRQEIILTEDAIAPCEISIDDDKILQIAGSQEFFHREFSKQAQHTQYKEYSMSPVRGVQEFLQKYQTW